MSLIVWPEPGIEASTVGGKAAALARLSEHGFTPPPFFVIQTDAFVMTEKGPRAASGLKTAIADALETLGAGPFAVRSSGLAEDGAEHSHAGQFDTFLNVTSSQVFAKARAVWESGFSEAVNAYRALKSGEGASPPAIIVQRMIDARAAGVAFSADPVSGQRDLVVISAIKGLGEALVSGEEDGESWIFGSDGIVEQPEAADVLSDIDAAAVAELARAVETAFEVPQDIEWAFDGGTLHILQARPITTPLEPVVTPDNALTILDNSNIIESYPGVVSPLTYSFATYAYARVYRAFVRLLGVRDGVIAQNAVVFDNMLARLDGRVYYNLVNWYRALALLPGFSLNRSYMETMMGVSEPLPDEVTAAIGPPPAQGFDRIKEWLRLGPVAVRLIWQAIWLPRTVRGFYTRLNRALDSGFDPANANLTELATEYRQIESELLDRWDAPLVNDFLCMIAFGASRNLLEKWLGPEGLLLHNDVMIGQGDIVSAEPAQRIARIGRMAAETHLADAFRQGDMRSIASYPDVKAEVDAYLARFGDRCTQELKLESLPLTQDPSALFMAIAASAERPPVEKDHASDPDWNGLFEGHRVRKRLARWVVGWAKARVRDRENLRFERTRIFGHARRVLLGMGRDLTALGHRDGARDVFYLTVDEILGAVEGSGMTQNLGALVSVRRAEDEAAAERSDPPERIEVRGAVIRAQIEADDPPPPSTDAEQTATGCSAGVATATAQVIRDPRTESLTPGDILVASHTDPGWIAVFANASAIVVERGSLLSHSAIVARELGIPCVVGLKDATHWIKTGERIEVDGARGTVRKLDD